MVALTTLLFEGLLSKSPIFRDQFSPYDAVTGAGYQTGQ